MFAEARKQGTFEGMRLARGKNTESEVLARAGNSCGKAGVVLRGFPPTATKWAIFYAFQVPARGALSLPCASRARASKQASALLRRLRRKRWMKMRLLMRCPRCVCSRI